MQYGGLDQGLVEFIAHGQRLDRIFPWCQTSEAASWDSNFSDRASERNAWTRVPCTTSTASALLPRKWRAKRLSRGECRSTKMLKASVLPWRVWWTRAASGRVMTLRTRGWGERSQAPGTGVQLAPSCRPPRFDRVQLSTESHYCRADRLVRSWQVWLLLLPKNQKDAAHSESGS